MMFLYLLALPKRLDTEREDANLQDANQQRANSAKQRDAEKEDANQRAAKRMLMEPRKVAVSLRRLSRHVGNVRKSRECKGFWKACTKHEECCTRFCDHRTDDDWVCDNLGWSHDWSR